MSDRRCNYCEFQALRRRYRGKGGVKITADPLTDPATGQPASFGAGGVRVVERQTGKDVGVWYAELPDHCVC